jgi:hypothetical protein
VLIDLMTQAQDASIETDIAIIGAGLAGVTLAAGLRQRGLRVVVLERGDHIPDERPFDDAGQNRGALPCLPDDFDERSYLGITAWPAEHSAVMSYLPEIEAAFKVDCGGYDEDLACSVRDSASIPTGDGDILARFAKAPTYKVGYLAALLGNRVSRDADLAIWLNATATTFDLNRETGRLRSITAKCSGGKCSDNKRLTVAARQFVICAGSSETTRLLLLIDLQHQDRPFRSCYALGRYLHDQAICSIANILAEGAGQEERLNRLAAPRFTGSPLPFINSTLRRPCFKLSPSAQKADSVTDAFGYITAECERREGGIFWKESLRWLLSTDDANAKLLPNVWRDLSAIAKATTWRWQQKQLYWPAPSTYTLHAVIEQEPQSAHRISLGFERDAFGAPAAEIRWGRDQSIARAAAAFCRRFDKYWSRQGFDEIGKLEFSTDPAKATPDASFAELHQPSGGARMGSNGVDAVVDRDLGAFAIPNLSLASRAVFPSSACGDPTLTLMLLSMRLADRLARGASI